MKSRLQKAKKALALQKEFDAILISKRENIHYITGYHGHDAWLLLTQNKAYLITDGRYTEESEKFFEAISGAEVKIFNAKVSRFEMVKKLLAKHRITKLGIEMMDLVYGVALHLTKTIAPKKIVPVNVFVESMRMVKEPDEILKIRHAVKLDEKVFDYLLKNLRVGMSEIELVRKVEQRMRELGGDGPSYPTIVAASQKAALPHAISDSKKIKKNDMLLIDMGTSYQGYVSDLTRTFFLGKMSAVFKDRYAKVLEAQSLAISLLKPGLPICELEQRVRKYFSACSFKTEFCHSLGHGIGLEIHELPWVNSQNRMVLKENMAITIEPGLYFPGWGGIRIEDDVLITKNGCEVLSKFPKSLKDTLLN